MKKDRKSRDKPKCLWSPNVRPKRQEYTFSGEKNSLLNRWCWGNWTVTCKRMKLEHSLILHTKMNSEWIKDLNVRFSQLVQFLSHVWLFATAWIAACQASLSITNFWNLLQLRSVESVMPSNHLILCRPLLLLPSVFPSIRVFSKSQFFTSGG